MAIYRRFTSIVFCFNLSLLALPGLVSAATISGPTNVTINGIGASGAWWPIDISLFPSGTQETVAELLFDPDAGLGITDYRYNLGGGGVWVGTPSRAPETPYISDGVYNWSADPQGTYFLRAAAQYEVPIITLFVNSAPTTFTNNSRNCGGTLISDRIDAYAQYLADVVSHWSSEGVNITHVSPMNEPDSAFDDGNPDDLCGQEGMRVLPDQRAQVVQAVASAFAAADLTTQVIADESSTTSNFFPEAPVWLPDGGPSIAGVAHHQYGFADDSTMAQLGEQARNLSDGKYSWFTEICCYTEADSSQTDNPLAALTYGQRYDPTMVSALRMGNLIWQAFTQTEDEHWDWWTALSSEYGSCTPSNDTACVNEINDSGWDDGLIYYDPDYKNTHYYSLSITKRFYVLKHFARAVPVGATSLNITDAETNWRVLAFGAPGTNDLYSVVAMNAQQVNSTLILESSVDGGLAAPKTAYMTSPNQSYIEVDVGYDEGQLTVDAPATSIFTLFF